MKRGYYGIDGKQQKQREKEETDKKKERKGCSGHEQTKEEPIRELEAEAFNSLGKNASYVLTYAISI